MNAERRKRIQAVQSQLNALESELESLAEAEQEAFDAMPESFRDGERGEKAQACIDALDNAFDSVQTCNSDLDGALE
jgi:hypothetical protein